MGCLSEFIITYPPIHELWVIKNIDIENGNLFDVSCLDEIELWTCVIKSFHFPTCRKNYLSLSKNIPGDKAGTRAVDLVYIDYYDRSINMVSNHVTQPFITLRSLMASWFSWTMQTIVVRYYGSTEK